MGLFPLLLGGEGSTTLNFLSSTALPSYVTFTRASVANYFDITGTLTSAATDVARFDYDPTTARTNNIQQSQTFENAYWGKTGLNAFGSGSVADTTATTAPDGTNTAEYIQENTANSFHCVQVNSSALAPTVAQTLSVYAKAAERGFCVIRIAEQSTSNQITAVVNLSTGATSAANTGTGAGATASATDVGNGWWRITLTGTPSTTGTGCSVLIGIRESLTASFQYTGDGASGIYIWGAQWETGASATAYIPTTSAAVTQCNPEGFMVEGAKTNFLLNSTAPATQTTGSLATGTYTLWVEGTGTATSAANTAVGSGFGIASAGSPNTFTVSSAGTVNITVTGSLTRFQLENGPMPTSFITTAGATATRALEVATAPASSFNVVDGRGTLIVEFEFIALEPTATAQVVCALRSDGSNRVVIFKSTVGTLLASVISGGVDQGTGIGVLVSAGSLAVNTVYKVAIAYAANDLAACVNGGTVGTDTSATIPTGFTNIDFGGRNGGTFPAFARIRSVTYYPSRLPDAQLQSLTA